MRGVGVADCVRERDGVTLLVGVRLGDAVQVRVRVRDAVLVRVSERVWVAVVVRMCNYHDASARATIAHRNRSCTYVPKLV